MRTNRLEKLSNLAPFHNFISLQVYTEIHEGMLTNECLLFLLVYDVQFSVINDFSNVRVIAAYKASDDQSRGSKA